MRSVPTWVWCYWAGCLALGVWIAPKLKKGILFLICMARGHDWGGAGWGGQNKKGYLAEYWNCGRCGMQGVVYESAEDMTARLKEGLWPCPRPPKRLWRGLSQKKRMQIFEEKLQED